MVKNITKSGGTTQIVKIHIGDKGKKEPPKKKRTYKRKPKNPIIPSGTGNQPWTGQAQLDQLPLPAFSRQGWTIEPLQQIRRLEEPPIQRIENSPQMNIIYPPRQIRDYVSQMLEQSSNFNGPRIEEVPEVPQRIEAPAKPVEEPFVPLLPSLPSLPSVPSEKVERRKKVVDVSDEEEEFVKRDEGRRKELSASEIQELRDKGLITKDWLEGFTNNKYRAGEMNLRQIGSKLGIPIPKSVTTKSQLVNAILSGL